MCCFFYLNRVLIVLESIYILEMPVTSRLNGIEHESISSI